MSNFIFKLIIISFLCFCSKITLAQSSSSSSESDSTVTVTMKNGEVFSGTIVEQRKKYIIIKTENGKFELLLEKVDSIKKNNDKVRFKFPNPHSTRYFFGPSAIPLKKRKGYYQNLLVTTNFVNYGITNNISVGGGLEFISSVLGEPIWFLTPKFGLEVYKNIHLGGGVFVFGSLGNALTLTYGVATIGGSESNFSIGAGFGATTGASAPTILISGTHRLSKNIALLSENYLLVNSNNFATLFGIQGLRILSQKNAFDIGALIIPEISDYIPALPFAGYVRVF